MNILLVYYEPIPAGQTTHVLSLAHSLACRGYRLTVVLPAGLSSRASFEQAGVQVVPLPMGKVWWPPRAIMSLLRLIRTHNFDVVHIHSQEAGLVARPLARLAGARRILYTPQTIDIRQKRWQWLYSLVERVLATLTDVIISVNETDRARLLRWGISPHRVVTVPNGIDLISFDKAGDEMELEAVGLSKDLPLVMQVGRLGPQKDPLAFVEGAAHVLRARPDVQFALVGEGPLQNAVLARIEQLGLAGQVRLTGWRDQAFRLMGCADIVTLTSRWEGTPYALLEAMACSRPVVATAVNGCVEIVAHGVTGFLTPPGDIQTWAKCVLYLLEHPAEAAAMGRAGRQRVEEGFTLQEMVRRIEQLYQV